MLFNGDCFKILKDIPDNSVDCIITDPPYLMDTGGRGHSEISIRNKKRRSNELEPLSNFGETQINTLANEITRVSKKVNAIIFASKNQIRYWFNAFSHITPTILFWGKSNPMPLVSNTLLSDVEYVLYFREQGVPCYANYRTGSRFDITSCNQKDKVLYNHPTIKPVSIISRYMSFMTQQGDLVLDPFMGTGSTGVACVKTNREFIGIELDKQHFQTAKDRIEQAIKDKACEFDFGEEL